METCGAFHNRIFLFLSACLSGILFALVWRKYEQTVQFSIIHNHYISSLRNSNYHAWIKKYNLTQRMPSEEILRYTKYGRKLETESMFLYRNSTVLCLIFVNSYGGADAVKKTWAKHCNIVAFFGRFVDDEIPVMKVPPVTSFEGFCYAFVHVFQKYTEQFQWLLIADDNTYAIIDNLRHYVAPLNSSMPYYLGHPVKGYSNLYNAGAAGIVLSYGSLLLLHSIYQTAKECTSKGYPSWYFDQSIGKIFNAFNVHPLDTRDSYSRGRFNPFSVETMLIPGSISIFNSYWRTSAFLSKEGLNCCSDKTVTFHGLLPSKMYLMEYILYHLEVFQNSGQGLGNKPMNGNSTTETSRKDVYKIKQIGEPYVQMLDKDGIISKEKIFKSKKPIIRNIWSEIFGSK